MTDELVFLAIFAIALSVMFADELSQFRWLRWVGNCILFIALFAVFFGAVYLIASTTDDFLGHEGKERLSSALVVIGFIWLVTEVDRLSRTNRSLERRLERLEKDLERHVS